MSKLIPLLSALQLWGGRGRTKEELGGKLSGCNEWMAWCIWVETGKELGRKVVSSHIQVLKAKMEGNDECEYMIWHRGSQSF